MDTINLKDILTGSLKTLPYELTETEKLDFVKALADALRTYLCEQYPDGVYDKTTETIKEEKVFWVGFYKKTEIVETEKVTTTWIQDASDAGDNFLAFLMDNDFSKDIVVMGLVYALRIKNIEFNSETDTFERFFRATEHLIIQTDK